MPQESLYPSDWFRYGKKDLRRVRYMLDMNDPEAAGFFLQQALEKYLKGYLLAKGWRLKKIHQLDVLLNDAIKFEPLFDEYRSHLIKITEYYIEERYPYVVESELTIEEVKESLARSVEFIEMIVNRID